MLYILTSIVFYMDKLLFSLSIMYLRFRRGRFHIVPQYIIEGGYRIRPYDITTMFLFICGDDILDILNMTTIVSPLSLQRVPLAGRLEGVSILFLMKQVYCSAHIFYRYSPLFSGDTPMLRLQYFYQGRVFQ